MNREAVLFLLKRYLPCPLSREALEVLMMALEEIPEEHPDPRAWQESIQDLLADDTGLLDLLEEDADAPEALELARAVDEAAQALARAAFVSPPSGA